MRSFICLRVLMALATASLLALVAMGHPVSDNTAKNSTVNTSGNSSSGNATDINESMDRIFTTLVEHTFGPQHLDHADLYYKTRFFASHMQARMR
ncbi:hypothetical protein IW150_007556, partial [Coemansia sp. RSA 2607]